MYAIYKNTIYRIAGKFEGGKFGEFGKSSMILPAKSSNLVLTIDKLLADLLFCQNFFHQTLEKSQFTKFSCYTVCRNAIVYHKNKQCKNKIMKFKDAL